MKTIAVAARTMDRQKRYQSLLAAGDYTVLPALDCLTLARLAKSRPVDVIIFDLQHPAMSAHDWLAMIDRDPELTFLPTVWVGQDVLPGIFERIKGLSNSLTITARPDMQTLIHAIKHVFNSARDSRKKPGDTGPIPNSEWQPGEGIIDQALSIFDQPAEKTSAPPEPEPPMPKGPDWHVSEVKRAANGHKPDPQENKPDTNQTETAELAGEPVPENSNLALNVEEVATGKFTIAGIGDHKTDSGHHVVPEKMMPDESEPQFEVPVDHSRDLVDRITSEVLSQLAEKLAKELISRINPDMVRRLVEKKMSGQPID